MEKTLRILIVDDNPDDRVLIKRELSREFPRVQVTEVTDAQTQAQTLALAGEPFHVAITDYQLGWSNGLAILQELKARWPECPVVMFTGTGSEEIAVEAMKNGLEDYVLKTPRHYIRLVASVNKALKRRKERLALLAAEDRYSRLFTNVPIGLYRITPAGEIVEANPALVYLLGYPARETLLAVKSVDFYADPGDKQRWFAQMQQRGEVRGFELQLRKRDGSTVWVRNNARTVRDEAGEILGYEGSLEDVTPYRHAVEALRCSEEKYRNIFDRANLGIFQSSVPGKYLSVNPAFARMLGYDSPMEVMNAISDIAQEVLADSQARLDIIRRLGQGEDYVTVEVEYKRKDGERRIGNLNVRGIGDGQGGLAYLEGFVEDITARRQAEAALKQREREFRMLLINIPAVVFNGHADGAIDLFDRKIESLMGYAKEDFDSHRYKWTDLIVEEDLAGAKEVFVEALHGDKRYVREYRVRNKAGKIVWIQERSQIVCDSEGQIRHICGVIFDITARKEAEEEAQLKAALLDAVSDSVFLHDMEGHFHYVNEAAYKTRGYSQEELLAQSIFGLPTPENVALRQNRVNELLKHGDTIFESAHLRKDGSIMPVEVHARLIALNDRTLILSAIRDITERKLAEAALADSFAKLHQTLEGTVVALATTVEMRDPYTAGHQRRVTQLACALARELGFPPEQIEGIRVMGFVHDIGKIAVPAEILSKPGKISPMEFNLIKVHPQVGYDILKDIGFPWPVAQAVLQHHERLDGSGYPSGLTGGDIIPEAKILMVADVVEAMASHRPYRPTLGVDQALEEITRNRGILYDTEVVDVCVKLFTDQRFTFS